MTKAQIHKESIKSMLVSNGWEYDRWGHLKKTLPKGTQFRAKLQKTSVRFEKRIDSRWFNSISDYYKNITVGSDHIKIKGFIIR